MKSNHDQTGIRIRTHRKRQGRSQSEVAAEAQRYKIRITRDMMANWETCRSVVPADVIPCLARILNVEAVDLLPELEGAATQRITHFSEHESATSKSSRTPQTRHLLRPIAERKT